MKWDESKHPRDKEGRFTNVTALVQELKPNPEIEKLKSKSVDELKKISRRNAYASAKDYSSKPQHIGNVDFSNEAEVVRALESYEKTVISLPYEVCFAITTDGKVWRINGSNGTVNPSTIPHELKGAYTYHNHPSDVTWFSFSDDDVAFFLENEMQYSKASDNQYDYIMFRNTDTKKVDYVTVKHTFYEMYRNEVLPLAFQNQINIDLDGFHETVKRLSKEYGFTYQRSIKYGNK